MSLATPQAPAAEGKVKVKRQPTRRNLELFLLILALGVTALADYLVSSTAGASRSDTSWITHVLVLGLLGLGMNIALRIWAKYADPFILPIVVALNGIGLAMIHRLDLASVRTDSNVATNQLIYTALGMASAVIVLWAIRDHRILRRFTYVWLAASVVLLIMPLIPGLGVTINGARIWVRIGTFSLQPGEFAKITLALFFASYLGSKRDLILLAGRKLGPLQLPRARDLGPMIVAWLVALAVLVFQRDLGSAIMFFGLFMVMIYVATGRVSWIVIGLVLMAAGGTFAMLFMGHVQRRVNVWLNALDPTIYDQRGGSAQIVQGLFAMANGGLPGTGFGGGQPQRIPLANSDMIYASLGEELGLIGLSAIVMLYLLLVSRGIRAALGARDGFGKLLATGLTFILGLQFFIVTAGVLRVMPLTGLTTPFLSAGGSSLLANWILISLLLLISHNARRPSTGGGTLSTREQDLIDQRAAELEAQESQAPAAATAAPVAPPSTARTGAVQATQPPTPPAPTSAPTNSTATEGGERA